MEFYERASGARMHAAYVRPGGVALVSVELKFSTSNDLSGIYSWLRLHKKDLYTAGLCIIN